MSPASTADHSTPSGAAGSFKSVLRLAGITGLGQLFENGLRLLTNIIITRTLGAAEFGIFSLAMTVVNMGAVIPRFGLPRSVTRFVAFYQGRGEDDKIPGLLKKALSISTLISIVTVAAMVGLAPIIAGRIFHKPELIPVIRWLSPFIPFGIAGMVLLGALQGLKQITRQVLILHFLWPTTRLVLIVVFFMLGWRLYGLVAATVLAVVVRLVVSLAAAGHLLRSGKTPSPGMDLRRLLFFSGPLFLAGIFNFALNWTDTLMLGYYHNAAQVGIYTVCWRLSLMISLPLGAFIRIFNPMAASFVGRNDLAALGDLLQRVNGWILTVSLPLAIAVFLFPKQILAVFGGEFMVASPTIRWLVIGQLLNAAAGPCGNVLTMKGWTGMNLANAAVLVSVNIVLNLLLIPKWAMVGAAVATTVSLVLINLLRALEVGVFLKMFPYHQRTWFVLACGAVAAIPATLLKSYSSLLAFLVFALLYAAMTCLPAVRTRLGVPFATEEVDRHR